MQESKSKRKQRYRFQTIDFYDKDLHANAQGKLTSGQQKKLYQLWREENILWAFEILFLTISLNILVGQHIIIATLLGIFFLHVLLWSREVLKVLVVSNVKVESFTAHFSGISRFYGDDSWYLVFDDTITFALEGNSNKIFKYGDIYEVFTTDKEKIIVSAREVDKK